jgi:hypothetical protein
MQCLHLTVFAFQCCYKLICTFSDFGGQGKLVVGRRVVKRPKQCINEVIEGIPVVLYRSVKPVSNP